LLLTTPMADLEEKEEWNKPLSVLHCITGPLFVVIASGSKCPFLISCFFQRVHFLIRVSIDLQTAN
jgi:hypothetical protein